MIICFSYLFRNPSFFFTKFPKFQLFIILLSFLWGQIYAQNQNIHYKQKSKRLKKCLTRMLKSMTIRNENN